MTKAARPHKAPTHDGLEAHDHTPPAREHDGDAFVPDPGEGPAVVPDDLAQVLAEDFLIAATSGEEVGEEVFSQAVPEDVGGPASAPPTEPEFAFGDPDAHPVTARPTAALERGPTGV